MLTVMEVHTGIQSCFAIVTPWDCGISSDTFLDHEIRSKEATTAKLWVVASCLALLDFCSSVLPLR